jgi:hypothetical protein
VRTSSLLTVPDTVVYLARSFAANALTTTSCILSDGLFSVQTPLRLTALVLSFNSKTSSGGWLDAL